jgi:hypothetical protein
MPATRSSSARLVRLAVPCLLALCPLVASLFVQGCSSNKMTIDIESTPETNAGRPFYAVIRAAEEATFVTDSYEAIAGKVFANPPDPTVLKAEVVYPGIPAKVTFTKPDTLPLAVYFLFNSPGERWKISKPLPLPSSVEIDLGRNDIKEGGS